MRRPYTRRVKAGKKQDILKFSACINAPVPAPREGQEEVNDVA
jgi:hypothetical protein